MFRKSSGWKDSVPVLSSVMSRVLMLSSNSFCFHTVSRTWEGAISIAFLRFTATNSLRSSSPMCVLPSPVESATRTPLYFLIILLAVLTASSWKVVSSTTLPLSLSSSSKRGL